MRFILAHLDPHAFMIAKTAGVPTPALTQRDVLIGIAALIFGILSAIVSLSIFASSWLFWKGLIVPRVALVWIFSLFLMILPFVTAAVSALMTSRHTQTEHNRLLTLTNVSYQATFQGHWLAAIYHLRILLIIAAALVPAILITRIGVFIIDVNSSPSNYDPISLVGVEMGSLGAVRLIGAALLGALIGVYAGSRHPEFQSIRLAGTLVFIYYVVHFVLSVIALIIISLSILAVRQLGDITGSIVATLMAIFCLPPLTFLPYGLVLRELRAPRLFRYDAPAVALPSAQS